MGNFEQAFKPYDWQGNIVGMTKDGYKAHLESVFGTFLGCDTPAGKETFDKCIAQVTNIAFFGKNMVTLLKDNVDKVMMVRDTDLLIGYVVVEQLTSSIKYYIDYRVADKLKKENKMPRTAEDVFNFFVKNLGFVPLKYKAASLSDLSDEVSYKFDTIKRIMDEGDNSDAWSNAMKVQLMAGFSHLEYLPNSLKYYFVIQGKHGWYLRADSERNEILKKKHLEKIAKEKAEAEAAEENAEAVVTEEVAEA